VAESLKSDALIVPETTLVVQYNVWGKTAVVFKVNVTEDPSFTVLEDEDNA